MFLKLQSIRITKLLWQPFKTVPQNELMTNQKIEFGDQMPLSEFSEISEFHEASSVAEDAFFLRCDFSWLD